MKALGLVSLILGGLVVALLVTAGVLYASDYGLEATITETHCNSPLAAAHSVTVQTKLFGIRQDVSDLDYQTCTALSPGNLVVYHIRTGRTLLYERDGAPCSYDSATGAPCVA
jgi:hypothetical protein